MANAEFGTVFFSEMTLASFDGSKWSDTSFVPSDSLPMHPAAHVLHYASTCFEGMKAFRGNDGSVNIFRIDDHVQRMQNSAASLHLPIPDAAQLKAMIIELLRKFKDQVPAFPGSAYIRPTLIGTDPAIGRAAAPTRTALLYVLVSPVGDYFSADTKMRVLLDTENQRCAPHFGTVKSGGNYASALGLIQQAKEKYNAAQVIFAPHGDVQETGAANCLLINDHEILTKPLNSEFLPGITRDSLLKAGAKLGYKISERNISADELIEWIKTGEVALSGTAAVLAPVGEIVYQEKTHVVNQDKEPVNSKRLRQYLNNIQQGIEEDSFNWMTKV